MKKVTDIDFKSPQHLFKYLSFNDNALSILKTGEFWFSSPADFNDPFDCYFESHPHNFENFNPFYSTPDLAKLAQSGFMVVPSLSKEKASYLGNMLKNKFKAAYQDAGILCLSSTPYSMLMWSHYSNGHRGFCLGIERTSLNELGPNYCQQVRYRDDLPVITPSDVLTSLDSLSQVVFYQKSTDWSYEKEWRLVYMLNPTYSIEGKREGARGLKTLNAKITYVIVGSKSSYQDVVKVHKLIKGTGIKLYRMVPVVGQLNIKPILLENPELHKVDYFNMTDIL